MEQDIINGYYSAMCCTCLSTDRDLYSLNEMHGVYQMFKLLMHDFACQRYPNVTIEMDSLFCWECMAHLRKMLRFKKQVHTAQESLRDFVMNWAQKNQEPSCCMSLSALEATTKTDYDATYLYNKKSRCNQCFVVSTGKRKKGEFEKAQTINDDVVFEIKEQEFEVPEIGSENPVLELVDSGTDPQISAADHIGIGISRYERKRKIGIHTQEEMQKALEAIKSGKSIRQVALEYRIAPSTLQRYSRKQNTSRLMPNYATREIFDSEQEVTLYEYYKKYALIFYGLTIQDCRQIAYDMARMKSIPIPDNWVRNKLAGIDWFRGFCERFPDPLSLAKPEDYRSKSFCEDTVRLFFDNLENELRRSSLADGTRIYNLDELHIAASAIQHPSDLTVKSKRIDKGSLVSVCNIVSAGGIALPPVLVYPRKGVNPYMSVGTPASSLILATPTGCLTSEMFLEVMEHFILHTESSKDSPTLLVMDNHESHLSIAALDLAEESGVTVLILPQTLSRLQPLEDIHGSFKSCYNSAMESYVAENPGCTLNIYNIGAIVGQAFDKTMTTLNIKSSFRKTGLYPIDRNVYSERDFTQNIFNDLEEQTH